MSALLKPSNHVVDVLGNVIGRDQPILRMDKATEMVSLLSSDIFLDKNVVFFDPFCKAGELLFACAYMSCASILKKQSKLMDVNDIHKEIFESNRYFALAPDERHHRLSLRTFLGNTKSHDGKYNHIIRNGNYLSEIDGRLDKNTFKKEFKDMIEYIKQQSRNKKIIAVGNPPYQESDGGAGASSKQIYPFFVESLIDCPEIHEFILVVKAAWFSSGKGTKSFREKIVNSKGIRTIKYFKESKDVFSTVHIQGGICFLNWRNNKIEKTKFYTNEECLEVDLSRFDVIPDDPKSFPILEKILNIHEGRYLSQIAWSRKPFGLPTNYFAINEESGSTGAEILKCLIKGRETKYIERRKIKVRRDKVAHWKVAIPKAYATGDRRCTLPKHQIFLIEPNVVCTETYNILDVFETKREAEKLIKYLQTDFCRYLLGLRKLTQDIPRDRWEWVPLVDEDFSNEQEVFDYFEISEEEQTHIKKKVEEWS